MLIDWVTVLAQVVNFLILMALLKRFLYGPIVRAMDEREARIAANLKEAQDRKKEAQRELQAYRDKNREFDEQRERMLAEVKEEVEAQRRDLVRRVRQEVEERRSAWQEAVEREKRTFYRELQNRLGETVVSVARRALEHLADSDLEQRILEVFLNHLRTLDGDARERLHRAFAESKEVIEIASSFQIPDLWRRRIVETVGEKIAGGHEILFEESADLLCGIELRANGYKVAWTLRDYLDSLEGNVLTAIEQFYDSAGNPQRSGGE